LIDELKEIEKIINTIDQLVGDGWIKIIILMMTKF